MTPFHKAAVSRCIAITGCHVFKRPHRVKRLTVCLHSGISELVLIIEPLSIQKHWSQLRCLFHRSLNLCRSPNVHYSSKLARGLKHSLTVFNPPPYSWHRRSFHPMLILPLSHLRPFAWQQYFPCLIKRTAAVFPGFSSLCLTTFFNYHMQVKCITSNKWLAIYCCVEQMCV